MPLSYLPLSDKKIASLATCYVMRKMIIIQTFQLNVNEYAEWRMRHYVTLVDDMHTNVFFYFFEFDRHYELPC